MTETPTKMYLTPRETQVIHLLSTGYDQVTAAHELGISTQTVKNLLDRARKRNDRATTYMLVAAYARGSYADTAETVPVTRGEWDQLVARLDRVERDAG